MAKSKWLSSLPDRPRSDPKKYGIGKYGSKKFSPKDPTRKSWSRTKAVLIGISLMLSAVVAHATNAICESADTQTSNLQLCKPLTDVDGTIYWGDKLNNNWDLVDNFYNTVTSSITNLNASNLVTGTVPAARLSGSYPALTVTAGQLTQGPIATSMLVSTLVYTTGSYADPAWITSLGSGKLVGVVASSILPSTTVFTTGSYADPSWITSLNANKLTGGPMPGGIAIPVGDIDLSTANSRLNQVGVDTTTLKTALDTKLSSGAVPSGFVSFSTITTQFTQVAADTTTLKAALDTKLSSWTLTAHGLHFSPNGSSSLSLPAMGALGIVVGNDTSLDPSTVTLTAGSNVTITNVNGILTISASVSAGASASTGTYLNSTTYSFSTGAFGQQTIAGSTITFTSAGSNICVAFSGGTGSNANASGDNNRLTFLIDGAPPDSNALSFDTVWFAENAATQRFPENFFYRTKSSVASGSHSLVLAGTTDVGTHVLNCNPVSAARPCYFEAYDCK